MSKWRRIALEKVPSCKQVIEQAKSPGLMWLDLHCALEDAYAGEAPNEAAIQQIYDYALWCLYQSKNYDLKWAVAVFFFKHLPQHGKVRRDLPNRLPFKTFFELEPCLRYYMTDKEFKKFKEEFLSRKDARERRRYELQQRRNLQP